MYASPRFHQYLGEQASQSIAKNESNSKIRLKRNSSIGKASQSEVTVCDLLVARHTYHEHVIRICKGAQVDIMQHDRLEKGSRILRSYYYKVAKSHKGQEGFKDAACEIPFAKRSSPSQIPSIRVQSVISIAAGML